MESGDASGDGAGVESGDMEATELLGEHLGGASVSRSRG